MRLGIMLLAVLGITFDAGAAPVKRYFFGNAADVSPKLHGPALDLGGGGGNHEPALQWVIDHIRGCTDCDAKVDVVVLRASDYNDYNEMIGALAGVDSVETLVFTERTSSFDPALISLISRAELVFFAGGDQCNYVRIFNGTPIEKAIREVYGRGGAVGGSSAGLAIQGEYVYDACNDASARSVNALRDPFNDEISFTRDFFDWKVMKGTFTDTHFSRRDRMGRLMVLQARQLHDTGATEALGIGVDEGTSLVVGRDGVGTVVGDGSVYLVLADHPAEVMRPGEPLTYCDFRIWRIPPGGTVSLMDRPVSGYYTVSVNHGVMDRNPY